MDETECLRGIDKAAILLLSLGPDKAAEVLKHMAPAEIRAVVTHMTDMQPVSTDSITTVIEQLREGCQTHSSLALNTDDYIHRMLSETFGPDEAGQLLQQIKPEANGEGLAQLKWLSAQTLVDLFQHEHPQILALLLSLLDRSQSAQTLALFPPSLRNDLVVRIASLERVSITALNMLNDIIESRLRDHPEAESCALGGVERAAELLGQAGAHVEQGVLNALRDEDAKLARTLEDRLLVFEQVLQLADTDVQAVLKEIPSEWLLLALQGAEEPIRTKFWQNMSKRVVQIMQEELAASPPVAEAEIEQARRDIMRTAKRLIQERLADSQQDPGHPVTQMTEAG